MKLAQSKSVPHLPPRRANYREIPVNVFDSGHMSIDNIKNVYIVAAINAEKRWLSQPPGAEREFKPGEWPIGAAGAEPARFGSTRTAVYARNKPAWCYGGPPLELKRGDASDSLPLPEFEVKVPRPITLPRAPPPKDPKLDSSAHASASADSPEHARPGFVKRTIAKKVNHIDQAHFRAATTAPLGIGHNLPREQGANEYFLRRPEPEEYEHGKKLQLARGIRLGEAAPQPSIEPSAMAKKVASLFPPEAVRVLGPTPHDAGAPMHEAVRRRQAAPPTEKITGEHELQWQGGRSAGDAPTTSSAPRPTAQARPTPAGLPRGSREQPKDSIFSEQPGAGAPPRVDARTCGAPTSAAEQPSAVQLPKSKPIAHAGEDSRQTFRFGETPVADRLAFDPTYSDRHAHLDTQTTYSFGQKGDEAKGHFNDFGAVYSGAHSVKDTRSQVFFGDYVGPLGRSTISK